MHYYLLHEQMQFSSWNLSFLEFHESLKCVPILFGQGKLDLGEGNLLQNSPAMINTEVSLESH